MPLHSNFLSLKKIFRIDSFLHLRLEAGDPEDLVLEVVDPRDVQKFMYGVQITRLSLGINLGNLRYE